MEKLDQWIIPDPHFRTLTGHRDFVTCVAISPDGTTVATGSQDSTIKLWDLNTAELITTLKGHIGAIHDLAFSPNGILLASVGVDPILRIWNVAKKELVKSIRCGTSKHRVAFSKKGGYILFGSGPSIMHCAPWSSVGPSEHFRLEGQHDPITVLEHSPDGTKLVSAGRPEDMGLWDVKSKDLILRLNGHMGWIRSAAFSPDGKRLASTGDDNCIIMRDLDNPSGYTAFGHGRGRHIKKIAFSQDGNMLVFLSQDAVVFCDSGPEVFTQRKVIDGFWGPTTFATSTDRRYIVCSAGRSKGNTVGQSQTFDCTIMDFKAPNFGKFNLLDEAFV